MILAQCVDQLGQVLHQARDVQLEQDVVGDGQDDPVLKGVWE